MMIVTATMILLSLKTRKDPKKLPNSPKTQLVTLSVSNFYFSTLLLSVFPHSTCSLNSPLKSIKLLIVSSLPTAVSAQSAFNVLLLSRQPYWKWKTTRRSPKPFQFSFIFIHFSLVLSSIVCRQHQYFHSNEQRSVMCRKEKAKEPEAQ